MGFEDAIAVQDQRVGGTEACLEGAPLRSGENAYDRSGRVDRFDLAVRADDERRRVPCIRDGQRTVVAEAADHHRGKTIGRKQRTQKRVQPQHRARWIVLRDLLELLLDHRHDDGSVDSFSCHVSQREPHAPIGGMHEVAIAGERARGDGDRVHVRCAGRLQPAGVKQLQLDHATFGWHR